MSTPTRIIFMGTPDFAVPSQRALHRAEITHNWEIVAVVTQPDRPSGRGKKLTVSPVKAQAQADALPVQQPDRLRKAPDAVDALAALAPDLIVVAAYGLILPRSVLDLPTHGCVNVHASLLPAYRGASPITAAILDGLDQTGVSIMLMDAGMDTGPVLAQAEQSIQPDDTTATLSARLADQGASLLVETLPRYLSGEITPTDQADLLGKPSICRLIRKEAGQIDWQAPAAAIERMTRAYSPWPSAFTAWRGQNFKIWQAEVMEGKAAPGKVVSTPAGPAVGTDTELLRLITVQPAGKRAMPIQSLLNGAPDFVGSRLGDENGS